MIEKRRSIKVVGGGATALGFMLILILAGCQPDAPKPTSTTSTPTPAQDPVERGKYLVTILGCNDCHTPFKMGPNGPEPDMSRMLSGHPQDLKLPPPPKLSPDKWAWTGSATMTAFAGPWGISYSINLTPDETTGIGTWTEERFVKAIKTGKHWGESRPIAPPMPWFWYSKMTDEDLRAIFAYLRTIPPIKNQVPDYVPPAGGAPPAGVP